MNRNLILLLFLAVLYLNFNVILAYKIFDANWQCIGHSDEHCNDMSYFDSSKVEDPRVVRRHRQIHHDDDNHDYENMRIQHSKVQKWFTQQTEKIKGKTSSGFGLMQRMGEKLEWHHHDEKELHDFKTEISKTDRVDKVTREIPKEAVEKDDIMHNIIL